MNNQASIRLEPSDPRHRQLIHAAIKARDTEALASLKGNLDKPIDFIINWSFYAMIISSCQEEWPDVVTITRPQTRLDIARFLNSLTDPPTAQQTDDDLLSVPLDTYDFLL